MKISESGRTEENSELYYLRISTDQFTDHTKPIIVIEAGIIAREWITIPAAINIVTKLHKLRYIDM